MNDTSTYASSQAVTQQLVAPNYSPADTKSQIVQAGETLVRVDYGKPWTAPHVRARQLTEFTEWLHGPSPTAPQSQAEVALNMATPQNHTAHQPNNPNLQSELIAASPAPTKLRVDVPHARGINRHLNTPNFDTRNYTPPVEISQTIAQLKADGRILGDNEQPAAGTAPPIAFANSIDLVWPHVSNCLIGTPAILNLEMHVQRLSQNEPTQLVVASVDRGDGATTVAMSLARQFAVHGKNVLLVDADLSHADLANRLAQKVTRSWTQAISDRFSLTETIITDKSLPISLLPLISISAQVRWPRKILDNLVRAIEGFTWKYDLIVYDAGPVRQLIADISSEKYFAGLTLLVSGNRTASSQAVDVAVSQLSALTSGRLLLVENFSAQTRATQSKVG